MTPSGGRSLARFSVLDLATVRSGPTCAKIDAATLDALVAAGIIEQHKGETK